MKIRCPYCGGTVIVMCSKSDYSTRFKGKCVDCQKKTKYRESKEEVLEDWKI